jgi:son of sevenless-like protein
MNGYAGTAVPPGGMYVRAMFDYEADDATSLSFNRGDVIQVITQLESGWWDGVINGVRGWFPSNYCQVIIGPGEGGAVNGDGPNGHAEDGDADDDAQEDEDDLEYDDLDSEGNVRDDASQPVEGSDQEQEEAAFWIPQVTPDGRLYYYNTLTGVTTMELPMENASNVPESGPRDRNNVYIPESTRRPQELIAGSYERDEDDTDEYSGSDAEPRSAVEETPGAMVSCFFF